MLALHQHAHIIKENPSQCSTPPRGTHAFLEMRRIRFSKNKLPWAFDLPVSKNVPEDKTRQRHARCLIRKQAGLLHPSAYYASAPVLGFKVIQFAFGVRVDCSFSRRPVERAHLGDENTNINRTFLTRQVCGFRKTSEVRNPAGHI